MRRLYRWIVGAVAMALLSGGVAFSQQAAAPAKPAAGRAPAGPRVISPEILPDKRVTFRLYAPKAGTVVLNGNWTTA